MKSFLFVFALFFAGFSANSFAQATENQPNAETVSLDESALVTWNADRHDFGNIQQGTPVNHSFTFKNITSEPLIIDNVRTTCGCTAPTWSKAPILPGETSEIEISYNAAKEGKFNKVVKVFLKGQKEAEFLVIQGEVMPKGS